MTSAGQLADVLSDGGALELLLRLQRGKPKTFEHIRELAPENIDLGGALMALESAGLVSIAADGLELARPDLAITSAVTSELEAHSNRMLDWLDILADYTAAQRDVPLPGIPEPSLQHLPPVGDGTVADGRLDVRFVPGKIDEWWGKVFTDPSARLFSALPDLSRIGRYLLIWLQEEDPTPDPAETSLLINISALDDPAQREVLDALVAADVEVRLASNIPNWLSIVPGKLAALSADQLGRPVSGTMIAEHPLVIEALHTVLASWWRDGLQYPLRGSLVDKALALRYQGLDDLEIAAKLDVAPRTLQRQISSFMDEVGVRSRFELGVWWAERCCSRQASSGER